MNKALFIFFSGSGLVSIIVMIVLSIHFERTIGGHLKLAADANTTELAQEKIGLAIKGMEEWGFCNQSGDNCYTSVIYRTPDEDVGYWRKNIEATYEDLASMTDDERANNLIESNQLMKVRETLLDTGGNGDAVTVPQGISRYPNNLGYGLWLLLSAAAAFIFFQAWGRESARGW